MDNVEQAMPMVSNVVLNPAAMRGNEPENAPAQDNVPTERNADFDQKMREFATASSNDLMNENLPTDEYIKRTAAREQQEYDELQKWKDDSTLSANQRAQLDARLQMLEYSRNSNEIQDAYAANPEDPQAKANYMAQEKDLKEYRVAMQNAEEFKDSPAMERMRQLEKELEAGGGLAAGSNVDSIKTKMNEAMRDFMQELKKDPDAQEKVLSFIENNKDVAVIQKSGMLKSAQAERERQAEMGMGKGREENLENEPVKPSGAAKAGATQAENPMANDAANKEVAAAADDGKQGKIEPVRMDVADANEVQVSANNSGQQRESGVSAGM